MKFNILTLFPEIFQSFTTQSLISKAIENDLISFECYNFRQFGLGKHAQVDDMPYGGGAGMVIRPEPVIETLEAHQLNETHRVLISPRGKVWNQQKARTFSQMKKPITFICGRYEGFDARISDYVDEEISIGDYVLMGGEIAVMAIVESVSRLIPGVVGNFGSTEEESFGHGLLEYDQYTRPAEFRGEKVPDVLVSGNHQKIRDWRHQNAQTRTQEKRPDLWHIYKQDLLSDDKR